MMEKALTRLLGKPPMVVGPGVEDRAEHPSGGPEPGGGGHRGRRRGCAGEVPSPIITIDMGTATTVGVISEGRTYEGRPAAAGGQRVSGGPEPPDSSTAGHLLQHPKPLSEKPPEDCMRSGIVYGTAGMLDGIIDRIREQFGGQRHQRGGHRRQRPVIVAILPESKFVYDKYLLMDGLWAIYQKKNECRYRRENSGGRTSPVAGSLLLPGPSSAWQSGEGSPPWAAWARPGSGAAHSR